ncbi:MAG: acyl-CoA thioesterase [Colwellia sp.]|nr:acyl-CoA thioesterase [Colwellia sp.]
MFSEVIATRFSDTDGLGHINNTMVPVWFEGARDPVFKWFMPDLDLTQWNLILAKIDVEFHAQMYYGEKMEIRTYIGRIGGSSFDVYQELWQNGSRCASGTAVMVYFDYQTNKSLKIPEEIKVTMQEHSFPANS